MAKRKKRVRKANTGGGEDNNDTGLLWVQEVQVRTSKDRRPMANLTRWKKRLGVKAKAEEAVEMNEEPNDQERPLEDEDTDGIDAADTPKRGSVMAPGSCASIGGDDDSDDEDEKVQFTVSRNNLHPHIYDRLFHFCALDDVDEYSYRPSKLFVGYINWTFRRGFIVVFLSFLLIFFLINVIFAAFMKWAGDADPECIVVSGEVFGHNPNTKFADAFALSWTTFTTVGYGMIYTSTGTDHENQHTHCSLIVFLCTAESFIGLLYAGMCAAILFGKIGRIQSHAQVKFSNAICIQLGLPTVEADEHETPQAATPTPTPKKVALQDAPKPEHKRTRSKKLDSLGLSSLRDTPQCLKKARVPFPVITFQVVNKLCNEPGGEIMDANMRVVASDRGHGGSASVIASYMKVQLAEFEHPFFNRVWHGRHTLDAASPLLSRFAKVMISQNGGFWPEEWNNPKDVRNALRFSELIVTLTGISNVSAATVHAYKRYKYGDLLVGYEFAPTLYKAADTQRLKVDMRLIHDVVGQKDGRAEEVGSEKEDGGRGSFTSIRLEEKEVGTGH